MGLLGVFSHHPLLALLFSVLQDLQSSEFFLLQGPQLLLVLLNLLHLLLLHNLLLSLIENLFLLLVVKSLEMVGLNSVVSKLTLSSSRIFSHEVIVESVANLMVFLVVPVMLLFQISVSLLLSLRI